jgi:hypothetical protein
MLLKRGSLILHVMMTFSLSFIYAQSRLDVDEQVQRLTNELDLSEEQAVQVEEILTATRRQADKLRESGLDRREMMPQLRDLMESTDEEIESILNDEQLKRFREIVEKRKGEMEKRRTREFN